MVREKHIGISNPKEATSTGRSNLSVSVAAFWAHAVCTIDGFPHANKTQRVMPVGAKGSCYTQSMCS